MYVHYTRNNEYFCINMYFSVFFLFIHTSLKKYVHKQNVYLQVQQENPRKKRPTIQYQKGTWSTSRRLVLWLVLAQKNGQTIGEVEVLSEIGSVSTQNPGRFSSLNTQTHVNFKDRQLKNDRPYFPSGS